MARRIERLSPIKVAKSTAKVAGRPEFLADGRGLYLRIGATGSKSWIFRYMLAGKQHDMGLGPYPEIGLSEARQRSLAQRRIKLEGVDPIATRRADRMAQRLTDAKTMTFKQCAEAYIAAHKAAWKNPVHAKQWPSTLETYVYPLFGSLPVQAIDTPLVMKVLSPIWTDKTETASRVRGRIEAILDWAKAMNYREGENPARWKGHLDNLLPKKSKVAAVEHHAALSYAELPAFMADLHQREGVAARALEFTILTAARTGEAIGAQWSEIDMDARLWTVPASRMKASREHRVPLNEAAMAILNRLDRTGEYLFPGQRRKQPLSNMAMLALLKRMAKGDLTAHGFRSTFKDWATEQTSFQTETVEMALAHTVSDKVEAAYRRGDLFQKRRQLAEAWGWYC